MMQLHDWATSHGPGEDSQEDGVDSPVATREPLFRLVLANRPREDPRTQPCPRRRGQHERVARTAPDFDAVAVRLDVDDRD
jgi:hypothetical protein